MISFVYYKVGRLEMRPMLLCNLKANLSLPVFSSTRKGSQRCHHQRKAISIIQNDQTFLEGGKGPSTASVKCYKLYNHHQVLKVGNAIIKAFRWSNADHPPTPLMTFGNYRDFIYEQTPFSKLLSTYKCELTI